MRNRIDVLHSIEIAKRLECTSPAGRKAIWAGWCDSDLDAGTASRRPYHGPHLKGGRRVVLRGHELGCKGLMFCAYSSGRRDLDYPSDRWYALLVQNEQHIIPR